MKLSPAEVPINIFDIVWEKLGKDFSYFCSELRAIYTIEGGQKRIWGVWVDC